MDGVGVIPGGEHVDARGTLRFCNAFDLSPVKRFYTVSNSAREPRRGWILHRRETKWFFPVRGVTTVHVEEEVQPAAVVHGPYVLDAAHPQVLCVPPGHWFLIEQDGTAEVQVFSDCRVGEFKDDDFRRPL